jgi:uncharacterized protein (UPF0254 family)
MYAAADTNADYQEDYDDDYDEQADQEVHNRTSGTVGTTHTAGAGAGANLSMSSRSTAAVKSADNFLKIHALDIDIPDGQGM